MMLSQKTSRRDCLKLMAASAGLAATASLSWGQEDPTKKPGTSQPVGPPPERECRMQ